MIEQFLSDSVAVQRMRALAHGCANFRVGGIVGQASRQDPGGAYGSGSPEASRINTGGS